MVNSKQKGAAGEREFAQFCREHGFENVRRGQQFSAIDEQGKQHPDVVGLPGCHVEVKRVQLLNVNRAMEQSIREAGIGRFPIVAHRKNGKGWLVTMKAEDWFPLYGAWEAKTFLKIKV